MGLILVVLLVAVGPLVPAPTTVGIESRERRQIKPSETSRSRTLHDEEPFRVRVDAREDGVTLLELSGELDVVSMARFERALADVLSGNPTEVTFDVTRTQFVSVQGYDAMGRCSPGVPVTVRAGSDLAAKVLAMYGHDSVVTVVVPAAGARVARDHCSGH